MIQEEQIATLKKQLEEVNQSISEKEKFISEQKEVISQMQDMIDKKEKSISEITDIISQRDTRISNLEHQLEQLRKQLYGKKSEKNLPVDPNALIPGLFDEYLTEEEKARIEAEAADLDAQLTDSIAEEKHIRKKRVIHRTLDTSKLEIVEVELIPQDINLEDYVEIDREVTDKIIYVPSKMYIERTIRPKYVLKSHLQIQDPDKRTFEIASLPDTPVPKCMASSSILTEILIQKFLYHMPFYRIIQKFKGMGLGISDSTIGDWYAAVCVKLKPLYDLLKEEVFQSDYIQVDESTLRVIDNENNRTFKGYVWVVRDAIAGNVFFHYDKGSRSKATAQALLGGYRGAIQSDGYTSYDQFEGSPGKMPLGCLVHARRKFADALTNDKKRASEGLLFFSKLYEIEKRAKADNLSVEQIKTLRNQEAYSILQLFEKWLLENYTQVLDSSPIGKAIIYTHTLLPRLSRYVVDGRYNPDNNLVESAIRPLAIGRKNWLHAGSPASATRAAMMFSFISTCKAAHVDPNIWINYVIENIGRYQKQGLEIRDLLPQYWKSTER